MKDLDKKIIDTYREVKRKKKIHDYLQQLEEKMAEQLRQMDAEIRQLGYDLQWMESSYFAKVMQYKAFIKEKELCAYEYSVLDAQRTKGEDAEARLEQLLDQKEKKLITENEETAQETSTELL